MKILSINDVDLNNKKVLIRCDLNVPIKDGVITGDKRILAVIPTIKKALENNCGIILASHLGRPTEGQFEEKFSLAPVAAYLEKCLAKKVNFHNYDPELSLEVKTGEIVLLENIRFMVGEKKNDPALAAKLAGLCEVYIMEAFGAAHRAHASTEGAIRQSKVAVAGPLMISEIEAATKVLENPQRPLYAIVGGSKVSTKLTVLENLLKFVDGLILAGGIANTFLMAEGYQVGKSLVEADFVEEAKKIIALAKSLNIKMPLPTDVIVSKDMQDTANARHCKVTEIKDDEAIFDIGQETCADYAKHLQNAKSIVWNGPVGVFEIEAFASGTRYVADVLANSDAYTLICGGDSVAAIEQFELEDKMGYLSTGGGAFLEILEGKKLPAIAALEKI